MRDSLDTLLTEHSQTHTLRENLVKQKVSAVREHLLVRFCVFVTVQKLRKNGRDVTATLPLPTFSFYTQTPIGFDKTSGIERGDTCV